MKYNWNVYAFDDKLKRLEILKSQLKKQLSQTQNMDEKRKLIDEIESISADIYTVNNIIISETGNIQNQEKLLDTYEKTKHQLECVRFFWKDFQSFYDISENQKELDFIEKRHTLSKEDLIELTHGFFKSMLDKRLYGNFMKMFRHRKDCIKFLNTDYSYGSYGIAHHLVSTNENYILVNRLFTIKDIFTLIHECMHATINNLNPNNFDNASEFTEIDSRFAELLAFDYLKKYLPVPKLMLRKYLLHSSNCYSLNFIIQKINLIKKDHNTFYFKDNKSLKKFANELNIDIELLEYSISNDVYIYILGYIYAVEFYNLYLDDKEKALHHLEKLAMFAGQSPQDYYELLTSLNICPNYNMLAQQKEINRIGQILEKSKKID